MYVYMHMYRIICVFSKKEKWKSQNRNDQNEFVRCVYVDKKKTERMKNICVVETIAKKQKWMKCTLEKYS